MGVLPGYVGLACLIAVSACLSPMFPTIYGIALEGLGDDAKLASAGLIMAIGGGALFPPIQGALIDSMNIRVSFMVPLTCFLCVAAFGFDTLLTRAAGDKKCPGEERPQKSMRLSDAKLIRHIASNTW